MKSSNVVIFLHRQFRKSTFVLQIYNGHYAGGKSCETSRVNEIEMDPAFAAISRDNMLLAADQLSALSRGLRVTGHARSKLHLSDYGSKQTNKQRFPFYNEISKNPKLQPARWRKAVPFELLDRILNNQTTINLTVCMGILSEECHAYYAVLNCAGGIC